ncbi:MAG: hypothetical protein ACYCO0_00290 [Candidatus Micrarchaeaceae archaeon]
MIEQKHGKRMTLEGKVIDLAKRRPLIESARKDEKLGKLGDDLGKIIAFGGRRIFGDGLKECIYNYNSDGSSFFVYRLVPHKEIIDARMRVEMEIENSGLSAMVDDSRITVESRVRSGVPYLEVMAREVEATKDSFDKFCKALKKLVERTAPEL